MKPCQVIFTHDDEACRWAVEVKNANSPQDAREAFAAVIITAHIIDGPLQIRNAKLNQTDPDTYEVTPAV